MSLTQQLIVEGIGTFDGFSHIIEKEGASELGVRNSALVGGVLCTSCSVYVHAPMASGCFPVATVFYGKGELFRYADSIFGIRGR